jgi:hypothetical protein
VVGKGNQGLHQSLLGCIAESKYDISQLYFGARQPTSSPIETILLLLLLSLSILIAITYIASIISASSPRLNVIGEKISKTAGRLNLFLP